MAEPTQEYPASPGNIRVLGVAGGVLFALGLLSFALVYLRHDASPDTVRIAAGVGVLLGMGYPCLLYAGTLRRLAALEARLAQLERPRE